MQVLKQSLHACRTPAPDPHSFLQRPLSCRGHLPVPPSLKAFDHGILLLAWQGRFPLSAFLVNDAPHDFPILGRVCNSAASHPQLPSSQGRPSHSPASSRVSHNSSGAHSGTRLPWRSSTEKRPLPTLIICLAAIDLGTQATVMSSQKPISGPAGQILCSVTG